MGANTVATRGCPTYLKRLKVCRCVFLQGRLVGLFYMELLRPNAGNTFTQALLSTHNSQQPPPHHHHQDLLNTNIYKQDAIPSSLCLRLSPPGKYSLSLLSCRPHIHRSGVATHIFVEQHTISTRRKDTGGAKKNPFKPPILKFAAGQSQPHSSGDESSHRI